MAPSMPVTVQPSCVQTASMAENALSPVRASRNTPATESTSTAPPTLVNADPLTVTWTALPVNLPALLSSVETALPSPPLGEASDDELPQPENNIASVALDVAQHTPEKN